MAPIPGKGKALHIKGLKKAVDAIKFHRIIKPNILKSVNSKIPNWRNVVGSNPDVLIENGEIVLKSVDKYGKTLDKTLKTGLNASDFFK